MKHKTHIGLVDPHAKSNRGAHNHALFRHKQILRIGTLRRRQPRMISHRAVFLLHQECGDLLRALARQRINNSALARMVLKKAQKLLLGIILVLHREPDVWPVKPRNKNLRLPAKQLRHNIAPCRLIGRCRECSNRRLGKRLAQAVQRFIFRAEGSPPVRNAVRLVNRNQLHIQLLQGRNHPLRHQALRRQVQNPHQPRRHPLPDIDIHFPRSRRINRLRRNARKFQCRNLVLHQRHQRRNHNRQPLLHQRRNLVAQ